MNRFSMFLDYVKPSKIVRDRIEFLAVQNILNSTNPEWDRVRTWFEAQLSGKPLPPPSPLQQGSHDIVPVRARPLWPLEEFPWLAKITPERLTKVREEFLSLRNGGQFQTYRNPLGSSRGAQPSPDGFGELAHDKGTWSVAYLSLHSMQFDNTSRCPETMAILREVPRLFDHALFSVLAPNSHIIPHCGPTNKKLRVHLPLIVPEEGSCRLRVGDETVVVRENHPLVFDDSYVHEAWNDSARARAVLLFDVWHNDLSDPEVEFLELVQSAFEHHLQRQASKDVAEKVPSKMMNPYGIIMSAKERPPPNADVLWV